MQKEYLKSPTLSLRAKGLMGIICQLDNAPSQQDLMQYCQESKACVVQALMELEAFGLIKGEREKMKNGRFSGGVHYSVCLIDEPDELENNENTVSLSEPHQEQEMAKEEDVFIEMIYGGKVIPIPKDFVEKLKPCYPAIDVEQTIRDAAGWTIANEKKLKARKDWKSFLNKWLKRDQLNAENRNSLINGYSKGNPSKKATDQTNQYSNDSIGVTL